MSLSNILTKVSDIVLSNGGQKVLTSLGITVFTYGATQIFFDQAMSLVYQYWGGMGNFMYLLGISGMNEALGMNLSAVAVRVAMNSASLGFKKA